MPAWAVRKKPDGLGRAAVRVRPTGWWCTLPRSVLLGARGTARATTHGSRPKTVSGARGCDIVRLRRDGGPPCSSGAENSGERPATHGPQPKHHPPRPTHHPPEPTPPTPGGSREGAGRGLRGLGRSPSAPRRTAPRTPPAQGYRGPHGRRRRRAGRPRAGRAPDGGPRLAHPRCQGAGHQGGARILTHALLPAPQRPPGRHPRPRPRPRNPQPPPRARDAQRDRR